MDLGDLHNDIQSLTEKKHGTWPYLDTETY